MHDNILESIQSKQTNKKDGDKVVRKEGVFALLTDVTSQQQQEAEKKVENTTT